MKKETAITPPILPPLPPIIKSGCISKPGCNSQVVYILPYMKAA